MRRQHTMQFRREPSSVARARSWLAAQLAEIALNMSCEQVDIALLGLSELAANAVVHGAGQHFGIACTLTENEITIEASSRGNGRDVPAVQRAWDSDAEMGRGLFLVDQLCGGNWGWHANGAGQIQVHFTLSPERRS